MAILERLRAYADRYSESPYGREVEGTVELLEESAELIGRLTNANRDAVFRQCIKEYGAFPQIDMAIEEMSELIQALSKYKRAKGATPGLIHNIVDELADVRIMARQMEILFECYDEVEKKIDVKVSRQKRRLDERKENNND